MEQKVILSLLPHFSILEKTYSVREIPSGYIHSSYILLNKGSATYILQQFNTQIFEDPQAVYHNFKEVSTHLTAFPYRHYDWKLTKDNAPFFTDHEGQLWRLLAFVPDSTEIKQVTSEREALTCGKLLGLFHRQLAPANVDAFRIPIPNFHDLPSRWLAFEAALQSGITKRKQKVKFVLDELYELRDFVRKAPEGIPLRVCHNDTKLSNILFHKDTHEGLCFVDLDTLMPGYFYHDFGDMARNIVVQHSENHDRVVEPEFNEKFYKATIAGIKSSGLVLMETEIQSLSYGLVLMPFLHSIRAFTDYLLGDLYYKVAHAEQNLNRGKNLLLFSKSSLERKNQLDQWASTLWYS